MKSLVQSLSGGRQSHAIRTCSACERPSSIGNSIFGFVGGTQPENGHGKSNRGAKIQKATKNQVDLDSATALHNPIKGKSQAVVDSVMEQRKIRRQSGYLHYSLDDQIIRSWSSYAHVKQCRISISICIQKRICFAFLSDKSRRFNDIDAFHNVKVYRASNRTRMSPRSFCLTQFGWTSNRIAAAY